MSEEDSDKSEPGQPPIPEVAPNDAAAYVNEQGEPRDHLLEGAGRNIIAETLLRLAQGAAGKPKAGSVKPDNVKGDGNTTRQP